MRKHDNGVLGRLELMSASCTEEISIHPIADQSLFMIPDYDKSRQSGLTSIIQFTKKQYWNVYCYRDAKYICWEVERKNILIRMTPQEFERFFGKYEVFDRDGNIVV